MNKSFYSKRKQMHNISNLFYFRKTLYMFRAVFTSIIRSLRLYIQHQVYVMQVISAYTVTYRLKQYSTYVNSNFCKFLPSGANLKIIFL